MRMFLARPAKPPGLQKLVPGLMDGRSLVVKGTDNSQPIRPCGKTR
jgi:hypothetical protein